MRYQLIRLNWHCRLGGGRFSSWGYGLGKGFREERVPWSKETSVETGLGNEFQVNTPILYFWLTLTERSSKAYYLQQVHQPRHLPYSARLFGPDILEVSYLFSRLASALLIVGSVDVHRYQVVCGAHVLGPNYRVLVTPVSLPIYGPSTYLLWKSGSTSILYLDRPRGLLFPGCSLFPHRQHNLDNTRIYHASIPIPHR